MTVFYLLAAIAIGVAVALLVFRSGIRAGRTMERARLLHEGRFTPYGLRGDAPADFHRNRAQYWRDRHEQLARQKREASERDQ